MSVLLSAGLHGTLLAVMGLAVLPRVQPVDLIQVSLRTGGTAGPPVAAAAPSPLSAPAPVTNPVQPQPKARHRDRRPKRSVAARAVSDRAALTTAAPLPEPPGQSDGVGSASDRAGNNGVAGGGRGVGTGSGDGSGSGTGDGLDPRPGCLYCPAPRYPLIARARGWQGTVDVALVVLADGSVNAASLRRSSGYPVLDDAAIAVARASRFKPPAANGLPVPLRGRIEYRFELRTAR